MAFDGIVMANLTKELSDALTGGYISKIAQTEKDELLFTVKNNRALYRLLLSGQRQPAASLPHGDEQAGPHDGAQFLHAAAQAHRRRKNHRRHAAGTGALHHFTIEHLDEMGDRRRKILIAELMGKHSNLIFCNEEGMIIDSIKHISLQVSSVREVLPGRTYFLPNTAGKQDPLTATEEAIARVLAGLSAPAAKAVYTSFTGISPVMAEEFCHLASIDGRCPAAELTELERIHLAHTIARTMETIREGRFSPVIIYRADEPVEFSSFPLTSFPAEYKQRPFDSISRVLETYYASRSAITRIRQKSSDLRRVVQTALERSQKKYDLQLKQLKDTEKRDR